MVSVNNTLCYTVATYNTTKNINQDSFYVRVGQDDVKTSLNSLRVSGTTNVKKVSRLATGKFNNIHSSHSQTCTVNHTAHVTIKLHIVKVAFTCFNFGRVFL